MKLFVLLFFSFSLLFSNVYYSKVDPVEIQKISSNVVGVVVKTDENSIGEVLSKSIYIKIDSELDEIELKSVESKIILLKNTYTTDEMMLKNLEELVKRKAKNYKRVQALKIKSSVEKDREFYDLITSKNLLLNTQKELNSLKVQIEDLKLRRAKLQRSIRDKNLRAEGFTLYSIDVKVGQVVNIGTPLATLADTSKAILTIFLQPQDREDIQNRVIFIDGKKSSYKISRVLNISDSKNISKYMAQIIVDAPKIFSKLVKVELKERDDVH